MDAEDDRLWLSRKLCHAHRAGLPDDFHVRDVHHIRHRDLRSMIVTNGMIRHGLRVSRTTCAAILYPPQTPRGCERLPAVFLQSPPLAAAIAAPAAANLVSDVTSRRPRHPMSHSPASTASGHSIRRR